MDRSTIKCESAIDFYHREDCAMQPNSLFKPVRSAIESNDISILNGLRLKQIKEF